MSLTGEQIADLVMSTQRDLGRNKWTDLSHDLQDFVVMPSILKKERIKFSGSTGSEFRVQTATNGSARMTQLYEVDTVNVPDTLTKGYVPWTHATCNYGYDERELEMNASEYKIVDLVKTRRISALGDLAELLETKFWNAPTGTSDDKTPYGVPYYVVKASSATGGFNGGAPSGHTTVAAISPTTYTRWKNWNVNYTTVAKTDFVKKVRESLVKTQFKSPVPHPSTDFGSARRMIYTNYDVLQALETLLEQQNDNLGNDLASKDGMTTFRRIPVMYVPYLDADTSNPAYGIDWSTFTTMFLRGEYLKESPPTDTAAHRVKNVYVDCTFNWRCHDRRRNWVVSIAA